MIDLHLHTAFSDGDILDIKPIVKRCDIISITDHNTIQAYEFFEDALKNKNFIVGCEVTVDGAPDYLLYFPKKCVPNGLEQHLASIRIAEEEVIKHCYHSLGYSNWDTDIERAYSQHQRVRNARTKELAAIIHLYNFELEYDGGRFQVEDLKVARHARRKYRMDNGNPTSINIAFLIANKYDGKIILAHPIRSAFKQCLRNDNGVEELRGKLIDLMSEYASQSGKFIEWEYLTKSYLKRCGLSMNDVNDLRNVIFNKAIEFDFTFTLGSDAHSLKDYNDASLWLEENQSRLQEQLARWIFDS